MAETAFIVHIPEAEVVVSSARLQYDPSANEGVPPHVTILYPFMPPELVTHEVLQEIRSALRGVPAFVYSFKKIAHFPTTAYLAPESPEPFIELTRTLWSRFPEFPPFRGEHSSVIPHLTFANGNAEEAVIAAREVQAKLASHGNILGQCDSVSLIENSSGPWRQMHAFELTAGNA